MRSLISIDFPAPEMEPESGYVDQLYPFPSSNAAIAMQHHPGNIHQSVATPRYSATPWYVLLSRSLYRSHVLTTFFGPVLRAMIKQVCWHSKRSEAHRGLPEARPRTQNVMVRGQSEAHGDSNLYNTRQD